MSGRAPEGRTALATWPSATTRLVALLGWPARYSLSPTVHNAAFRELGLDLVYLALPTPSERLAEVVGALEAVEAVGANVTVPHKRAVVACCDELTEEARLVGAVNTLSWTADGLLGDNTDAVGLGHVFRDDLGTRPEDRVVVLGTGGAARATVVAAARHGCPVTVVGRRADAATELAELAGRAGAPQSGAVDLADVEAVGGAVAEAGVVVNATPLGMRGEALPDAFLDLRAHQTALDLVYDPPETPFLLAARERGADAHHGLGMLIAQAGASLQRWTGHAPPLNTMSAVALHALAARSRH